MAASLGWRLARPSGGLFCWTKGEFRMFTPQCRCIVVVGAQWGDEGKGKLVDVLAEGADLVVRYQGGANAGHTVVVGDEQFILQQIPSGILHPGAHCVVGNGVVLDPETFYRTGSSRDQGDRHPGSHSGLRSGASGAALP